MSNPREPDLQPISTQALADTGALMLCIPEHLALQFRLEQQSEREVTVADGRAMTVPYVGPVKVAFGDRLCFVGALVMGDDVLLGAVPMEDMDLNVHPSRQQVEPDPRSPNIPHALVK
ncbi:MAG: aspartyl protease family protein [Vulcanococcus sp.]